MTKEQFEDLKSDYVENLERFISDSGGLFPLITFFADSIDNNKPSIIHFPIPDEYVKDDETKDELVNEVIPKLAKEIKKDFNVIGVAWSSEAWMRTVDKTQEKIPEDYRVLPKKEVVIIAIEDENGVENIIYDIEREGKKVTQEGDIIDSVKLLKSDDFSGSYSVSQGRFVGILKNFIRKK